MRISFPMHLLIYLVGNTGFFLLNALPVGFDLDRQGVPIWFPYPLVVWGVLLGIHGVVALLRRGQAPDSAPAGPQAPVRPKVVGKAGELLTACRQEAGQVLTAMGAAGGVPRQMDQVLREAIEQAERITELLSAVYQAAASVQEGAAHEGSKPEELERALEELDERRVNLEERLDGLVMALKILRLEALALQADEAPDDQALSGPVQQLRLGIAAAREGELTLEHQG